MGGILYESVAYKAFQDIPKCPEKGLNPASHAGNRGSNPLGDANTFNVLEP